jgi:hypothetical protein
MLTTEELQSAGFVEIEADVWALPVGNAGLWLDREPDGWAVSFDPAGEYRWPHRVTTLADLRRIATAYGHPLTEAA